MRSCPPPATPATAPATVSFYMGAASPALQLRPADHTSGTMLTGDCSGCHTTANWNSTALPAGHMPNPGNQTCTVCHTAAPTNYATLAANAVLHTGITSGCITCHGAPNAAAPVSIYNNTPKDAMLSPVHIPDQHHAVRELPRGQFHRVQRHDHDVGQAHADVRGDRQDLRCVPRPVDLSFYGVTNLTTRPNGHHVGQDCSGCHSPNNWGGGAAAKKHRRCDGDGDPQHDRDGSVTRRAERSRRDGAAARYGASWSRRESAARRRSWRIAAPGVAGVPRRRHQQLRQLPQRRARAAGKGPTHIASNNACENCHTTLAWMPARFDHLGVTASCASCHNGVSASGKPMRHVQTSEDCSACHGTITWAAATFNHLGHQRDLPELPQRHHRHRQAGPAPEHDAGLRQSATTP